MALQAPKGTKDVLPADSYQWQAVEAVMRSVAAASGYREIRTPVFEYTELFLRGVGDTTDIVQKEMYTFEDKGGRSMTLKPEGTAGAVRALIEAHLYSEPLPVKMFYVNCPVFRYENPQHGRYREHHQFGVEAFGAPGATCDAEVIALGMRVLGRLGIGDLEASINSIGCPSCRADYHAKLRAYLETRLDKLCPTCRQRFERNPLRILDCKEEACQAQLACAPEVIDSICGDCAAHFQTLQTALDALGIRYRIDPRIVRGLDYYSRTVFEVVTHTQTGSLAVFAGGRYDGLVEQLGGPAMAGIGFGMGIERLLMVLAQKGIALPKPPMFEAYVCTVGADAAIAALTLANALREAGIATEIDHSGRSLKAQFKHADKCGARHVLLVGGEELARGVVKVRDMETRAETELPWDGAVAAVQGLLR